MLIVEGPDGAGKTNLVEYFEKSLGLLRQPRAVTSGAVPMRPMGEYIREELAKGFGPRLYDRFALISSPFYSMLPNPTFREELLDRQWLEDSWRMFRRLGPMIVLCLPPLEVVRKNVLNDVTSKVMWDHIDQVYWLYHNFAAQYPFIAYVWDYTRETHDNLYFLTQAFKDRCRLMEMRGQPR